MRFVPRRFRPRRAFIPLGAAVVMTLMAAACGNRGPAAPGDLDPGRDSDPPPLLAWPLSGGTDPDGDSIHAQFGPRALPSAYDFHAGIDLPAPRGTRVGAALPGEVVQIRTWNGTSTGAGNAVLIAHEGGVHTSYLHLHTLAVGLGDDLVARDLVGTVGSTGATYPHLHLGYFKGLPGPQTDERHARNPLEFLPFSPPVGIHATFVDDGVIVDLPVRRMTVQTIILSGAGLEIRVDYADILLRGSVARNEQVQEGLFLDAGRPSEGRFDLTLRAVTPAFVPERLVLLDFSGDTVFQVAR